LSKVKRRGKQKHVANAFVTLFASHWTRNFLLLRENVALRQKCVKKDKYDKIDASKTR